MGWNIVGKNWDNVSKQLNKWYNEGLVIFKHLNVEMLHVFKHKSVTVFFAAQDLM